MPIVLLIDDDAMVRSAVRRFFRDPSFTFHEADDGAEGLKLLRGGLRPDVILCDLDMPGMDGREFLAEREKDPALAAIPFLLHSGSSSVRLVGDRYNVRAIVKGETEELRGALTKMMLLPFSAWKEECRKHSEELLSLGDILDDDDPYDLKEAMKDAYRISEEPKAFIERIFEEDLARQEHDNQLYNESLAHDGG